MQTFPSQAPVEQASHLPSDGGSTSRQRFWRTLLDLVRIEWHKVTRRVWPLLAVIALVCSLVGLTVWIISAGAVAESQNPPDMYYRPTLCKYVPPLANVPCLHRELTASELRQMRQLQRQKVEVLARPLHLPQGVQTGVSLTNSVGLILLVVLSAFLVGIDFESGMIRLFLTRGASRLQVYLARLVALLLLALIIAAVLQLLVIGMGGLTMALRLPAYWGVVPVLNWSWLSHALLYVLTSALGIMLYGLVAMCGALWGRSTTAGIAAGLGWWIINEMLDLLNGQAGMLHGPVFLKRIAGLSLTNTLNVLLHMQEHALYNTPAPQASSIRILLVLSICLIVPLLGAWWLYQRRDVTA